MTRLKIRLDTTMPEIIQPSPGATYGVPHSTLPGPEERLYSFHGCIWNWMVGCIDKQTQARYTTFHSN